MSHANAPLTPLGRLRLARCVVEDGWPLRRAAERFQVSVTTAARWSARYRDEGVAGMVDRSSRPHRQPRLTRPRVVKRVLYLRARRGWGPARIGPYLGVPASTVGNVLRRAGVPRLSEVDLATRQQLRRQAAAARYEHHAPGDLVHVDIKKLGRIPDGGGWRIHGRSQRPNNKRGKGYAYLHAAVDDHSRLAYVEIHADEQATTAAAFWTRASSWFTSQGILPRAVLTDNGSCYRSLAFAAALSATNSRHRFTRPYRPQTNGKVERFNRTLLTEWAYARPYPGEAARAEALPTWLHMYNHHRHHTALGGPPSSRVPNLSGQYT
jgi:transposase InsO family protein